MMLPVVLLGVGVLVRGTQVSAAGSVPAGLAVFRGAGFSAESE